ncbi:MAG: PAS domain S-box protein [Desulfocapsaceae bacterium]|nr:PAS domain S-box protein [Desulfocapsaceae bacterium]
MKHTRIARLILVYTVAFGGVLSLLVAVVCSFWGYREDLLQMDLTLSSLGGLLSAELVDGLAQDSTRCEAAVQGMASLYPFLSVQVQGSNLQGRIAVRGGAPDKPGLIRKDFSITVNGIDSATVLTLSGDPEYLRVLAWKRGLQFFLGMMLFAAALSGGLFIRIRTSLIFPLAALTRSIEGLRLEGPDPPAPAVWPEKGAGFPELELLVSALGMLHQRLVRTLLQRKEAEALRIKERLLLTALINSIPDLIFYKDTEGVFLGCNTAFEEFSGWKMHELVGRTDFDLFSREEAEFFCDQDKKMFAMGGPRSNEEWVRYPDGRKVLLDTLKTVYRDENGEVLGLIGISRDITLRKAVENELVAAQHRFEEAFNASPMMIMILDGKASQLIDVNLPCLQQTGYRKQELLSRTLADLGFWGSDEDHSRIMAAVAREGRVEGFPVKIRIQSGQKVSCMLRGRKVLFSGVECLLFFLEDLSIREKTEQALQLSESRFRDFANSAADWFWEMDRGLHFTYLTGKVEEILGRKTDDLIGNTWQQVFFEGGRNETASWKANFSRIIRQEPFSGFEIDWLRSEGKPRRIVLDGRPIVDADGRFAGYRGAGRDITHRKEAEEALQRSLKMDAVGHVVGGIAHDFNNILGIIIGNLDFIQRFGSVDPMSLKRLEAVSKASERGSTLTRQLLDFSSHQARDCQPTNINTVLQGMDNLIARSVTPEVEVMTDLAADLWTTVIDSGDFEDVVLNLIINARDAMVQGGRLHISTSNAILDEYYTMMNPGMEPGGYVHLAVSDTGDGMPSEVLEHIFEPFYTTKPHGKGTGLGLSMVYAFAQRSKGGIQVYSEPGTGTSVHVYLPRSLEELPGRTGSPDAKPGLPGLPGGQETILIVDDEVDLLALAADMLKILGYTTLTAGNGKEAMALLLEKGAAIHLLFADVVMPGGMTGFALAEQALLLNPDLKVLFTSGYFERAIPRVGQFTFSPVLFKPYTELELAVRVHEVLHG